jgi:hypothetical protein
MPTGKNKNAVLSECRPYGEWSGGMFKVVQEAREASRSGDGEVVVPPAGGEDNGMSGVNKEKAAFDGNLLWRGVLRKGRLHDLFLLSPYTQ